MSDFICPVCSAPLKREGGSLTCENAHNFDLARQGYVHLLRGGGGKKGHGDDRRMIEARTSFLDGGHYDVLARRVAELSAELVPSGGSVLDVGCGEGYYTCRVRQALAEAGKEARICGIDISRDALIAFSRRTREIPLAVASAAALPVGDASCDLVLNLFAPQDDAEFLRVLKPGGHLLCVFPLEEHLMGLKRLVYETPYENPHPSYLPLGFLLVQAQEVRKTLVLRSGEEIRNLFWMTPYYYKTSREDQEKLLLCQTLETPIAFGIYVYQKQ